LYNGFTISGLTEPDLGNPTYAGILAAVTANVVLFAYIYVAWKEDQGDREEASKANSKKAQ